MAGAGTIDPGRTARAPGRPREAATEDAIIDAALGLLDEGCYSTITIEKIASRAGVGKPTIYRRWKTKADVVLDAYAARAARTQAYPPTDDAFADLQGFLERLFTVANHPTNQRAMRGFIAESQYDAEFRQKYYDRFLIPRRDAMKAIFAHGQALGQMRPDLDLEVACDLVYGAFAARLIHSAWPLDAAFAAQIVCLLKTGLGRPART
jgi:AcrR family transcriptional regulator